MNAEAKYISSFLTPDPFRKVSILGKLFAIYGFTKQEQHLDLTRLLYLSGCLDQQQLQTDLMVAGFSEDEISSIVKISHQTMKEHSTVRTLENFSPALFLSAAFHKITKLEKIHNWLIGITQREFFARQPGEERWQQKTRQWILDHKESVQLIVKRLGFEAEIRPAKKKYDAMVVFGATTFEMVKRLTYAKNLVDVEGLRVNHLYLLGSERPADKDGDGGEEFLWTVATKYNIAREKVTETHLMQEAYNAVKGKNQFAALPCTLIDTPMGDKPRPNTVDTLITLANEISRDVTSIVFISRAPNILAQKEDTWAVFKERFSHLKSFEVIGGCCEKVSLNLIIGALGGALFGGYPRVAMQLGAQNLDNR